MNEFPTEGLVPCGLVVSEEKDEIEINWISL